MLGTVKITHDWLVGKGLKPNPKQSHNVISFFFSYSTVLMAPICMVLALVGALDGTRGRIAVQQENASCCKGVHPYNSPILNRTLGITMGFYVPK